MKSVVFYLCKSVCLQFEKFTNMHGSELLIWFLPAAAANQIISCKIKWIYFGIYKAKMAVLLEIVKNATVYKVFMQQMVLTFFFSKTEWNGIGIQYQIGVTFPRRNLTNQQMISKWQDVNSFKWLLKLLKRWISIQIIMIAKHM